MGGLSLLLAQSWADVPSVELSTFFFNSPSVPGQAGSGSQEPAYPNYVPVFAFKSDPAAVPGIALPLKVKPPVCVVFTADTHKAENLGEIGKLLNLSSWLAAARKVAAHDKRK